MIIRCYKCGRIIETIHVQYMVMGNCGKLELYSENGEYIGFYYKNIIKLSNRILHVSMYDSVIVDNI